MANINNDSNTTTAKISATSPATTADASTASFWSNTVKGFTFLPDFTEHPKPKRRSTVDNLMEVDTDGEGDVSFFHDFIAGGMAGSASVIVGHPFDTIKVRLQMSTNNAGVLSSIAEFGGVSSLFRGMAAPLVTASAINAIVFSSYGIASRLFDEHILAPEAFIHHNANHDPWQKAMSCGMFAGMTQCAVICPMEHVKCRLQTQSGKSANHYKGPWHATRSIVAQHGVQRLFQGWWTTAWREIPAFGLYFASYDYLKDRANTFLAKRAGWQDMDSDHSAGDHSHTWLASAFAGGCAGSITWGIVYPVDVIKTRVQTSAIDTPWRDLSMFKIGRDIVSQHGFRYLFRGLGITLVRAFPVNGTIFPVYEFTLKQATKFTEDQA